MYLCKVVERERAATLDLAFWGAEPVATLRTAEDNEFVMWEYVSRHDLGIPFLSKSCKGDERGGHGGRREGTGRTPALEVVLVVDVIFGRKDARLALLR